MSDTTSERAPEAAKREWSAPKATVFEVPGGTFAQFDTHGQGLDGPADCAS